jgi:hypothetical protein
MDRLERRTGEEPGSLRKAVVLKRSYAHAGAHSAPYLVSSRDSFCCCHVIACPLPAATEPASSRSDFESDYNSYKGNAYGLANTLMQTALLKPSIKPGKLPNLYFAGQLTSPGPGVPPAIISGQVVAALIKEDMAGGRKWPLMVWLIIVAVLAAVVAVAVPSVPARLLSLAS